MSTMDGDLPSYPVLPPTPHMMDDHPVSGGLPPGPSALLPHPPLVPLPPSTHHQPVATPSDPAHSLPAHTLTSATPTSGYSSGSLPRHPVSIATPPASHYTHPPHTSQVEPIYSTVVKRPSSSGPYATSSPSSRVQPLAARSPVTAYSPLQSLSVGQMTTPQATPSPAEGDSASGSLAESKLSLRIQYLESLCVSFQKEKKILQEGFDRQRKQFMRQMVQLEDELNLAKHTVEKFSVEVQELSTQLLYKDEELKDLQMAASLAERASREALNAEKLKYEEEITSLRKIVTEQAGEQESHFSEKGVWLREKEALEHQLRQLGPPIRAQPAPPGSPQRTAKSPHKLNLHDPSDNLDTSMRKAREDTELLRSVVLPLEQEIARLKRQLGEAEDQMKGNAPTESLIDLDQSMEPLPRAATPTNNRDLLTPSPTEGKVMQLQHQLELERTSRHDLEMHTELLKSQKSALQTELSDVKDQLGKLRQDYERKRVSYAELRKTWQLANQHFVISQDQLNQRIYELEQRVAQGEGRGRVELLGESQDRPIMIKVNVEETGEGDGGGGERVDGGDEPAKEDDVEAPSELQTPASPTGLPGKSASWGSLPTSPEGIVAQKKLSDLEAENSLLHKELSRNVEICSNYESQLQRVQEQMVADMEEKERTIDRLRAEAEKFKAQILREKKFREDLRRQIVENQEEMKARVEKFEGHQRDLAQSLRSLREKFTEAKHDAQREVARFSDERVKLHGHLEQSREEYDCLKVLQGQNMADYQKKLSEECVARQQAEANVQATLEELSALRAKMTALDDELCEQVALLQEQLLTEKSRSGKAEAGLRAELEQAQRHIAELRGLREKMEREREEREEAIASRDSIKEKSRVFIEDQQRKLEKLDREKDGAEQQVRDLQRQLSALRVQLNSSEASQKDFVELSQSLQVRIAQMEDEKKDFLQSNST